MCYFSSITGTRALQLSHVDTSFTAVTGVPGIPASLLYGLLDQLFDASLRLLKELRRFVLLDEAFAHKIADNLLFVVVEQGNDKSINVGRVELCLSAASRVLLRLELADHGLKYERHIGQNRRPGRRRRMLTWLLAIARALLR